MSTNINGSSDEFFRYKMPKMLIKYEANGKKTIIRNIDDIAKSLKIPVDWVVHFFGIELACQAKYDEQFKKCVINGNHNNLQDILIKFINKFILCSKCGLPELIYSKKIISCNACGNKMNFPDHKLTKFIMQTLKKPYT